MLIEGQLQAFRSMELRGTLFMRLRTQSCVGLLKRREEVPQLRVHFKEF